MDENKFGVVKPSDLPAAEQRRMNPREPSKAWVASPTPQLETLPEFKDLLKRLRAKEKGHGKKA